MPRLELTVVFDGETVGLLLDLADQGERAYDFAGTASSVLKEVR